MKRWIEKRAIRIGVAFMVVYTSTAAVICGFWVRDLSQEGAFAYVAFIQGLGVLISLLPIWTGVTRLANPKLKVSYDGYVTGAGRTSDGQEVTWSEPDGRRTATYTRPFAALTLGLGLAMYGFSLFMTQGLG